ncbi:DUF489 family protein [Acinetobacter nectaris]|uniref:DUF489 family protein n=1 Tax=Acinetobacter nectaris TaxID=1219382 RepID=UPI001F25B77D|nr:DUF489 family protein [Acinetobacter nectaris]MCF9046677.1 DUF489 family protein [Acinetobacter nectaris]
MVDVPFQQPKDLTHRQNRLLALAGVFQAAQLTHMTAMTGLGRINDSGNFYFEQLIKASLNIRPTQSTHERNLKTLDFFHEINDLMLGLKNLEDSIHTPFNKRTIRKIPKMPVAKLPTSYALSLLQLEKKVYQNPEYVKIITQTQEKILKQLSFFDQNYMHPSIIANLAQAYLDTAAQIEPRILVRGSADAFKDSQHTNRIRASLFTGLQMAHLWRQVGGRSIQLVLGKYKLVRDLHTIARTQFKLLEK